MIMRDYAETEAEEYERTRPIPLIVWAFGLFGVFQVIRFIIN